MNEKTVKAFGELLALQAELEGMKAFNTDREMRGEALAYEEASFLEISHRMRLAITPLRPDDEEA
jgi:hypothetical protein